jgi:A/G-specific adenine glycosylase
MKQENSAFPATLLRWFQDCGRDLPWRHTRDPYLIWLSEIILQQTRVEQGRDYWCRFVDRWPTVDLLADATEDEVLRQWQGLGYYSRARNLHAAARQVVALGGFPRSVEELCRLRGVGEYTAAAIASFAFDVPAAVVDGNVYRVLSRYFGIDIPIDSTEGRRLFASLARELLPERQAADYNQAIMDFGATQCTPANPACLTCPLVETCRAQAEGRVGELPVKQGRTKVQQRRLSYVYIRCRGEVAIRKRGKGDFWQGLWEPYLMEEGCRLPEDAALVLLARDVKHILSHRRLLCDFYLWEPASPPALPSDYRWVREQELDDYAKPRLVEILLERVLSLRSSESDNF